MALCSAPYIVSFCGLPSSGKSSLINSLIGKRILQSGICRTTTETTVLSNEIIIDDDGNKFIAVDLPGICDSDEKDLKFNNITHEQIANANLICFVSDVSKAFITTHEVNEYNKIKKILNDLQKNTGTIYNICIILTKCDFADNTRDIVIIPKNIKTNDEIIDSEEDTDLGDLIKNVRAKLPLEDIILYNAFGRIKHNKNISIVLKQLINKNGNGNHTNNNISFNITKYYYNYRETQEISYLNKFNELVQLFMENKSSIEISINAFNKLSITNKSIIVLRNASLGINFKIFQLCETILSDNAVIFSNIMISTEILLYHLKYYLHIINTNALLKTQNLTYDFTASSIWDKIVYTYNKLDAPRQIDIMNSVIFKSEYFTSATNATIFVTKCFLQNGGFDKYKFEKEFNNFIKICDRSQFITCHNILTTFCTPDKIVVPTIPIETNPYYGKYKYQCNHIVMSEDNMPIRCNFISKHNKSFNTISDIPKIISTNHIYWYSNSNIPEICCSCKGPLTIAQDMTNYSIISRDNLKIKQAIDTYLIDFESQLCNPKYILYNKLQILMYLFNDCNISAQQTYHFKDNQIKGINLIEQKILNHPTYLKIELTFYRHLFSVPLVPFISQSKHVCMSIDELLYTIPI